MVPENFNYNSREWVQIRTMLEQDRDRAVDALCNPSCSHDEANQLRGRLLYIKGLLLAETAAARPRPQ